MLRRHDSPDEPIIAHPSAVVQSVRTIFSGKGRDVLWGLALGVSLVINAIAVFSWRDAATESRVKDYDLTFFMTHEFADIKVQTMVNQKLIEAYGLQKAVKDSAKGK